MKWETIATIVALTLSLISILATTMTFFYQKRKKEDLELTVTSNLMSIQVLKKIINEEQHKTFKVKPKRSYKKKVKNEIAIVDRNELQEC